VAALEDSLPTELDTFVGRQSELAEARRQLQDSRLVTLIGPPGVGKTRLSRHLIVQEHPAFPDGVVVANLTDITADDLYHTVSSALGILDNSPAVLDRSIEFVRQHQDMLLVLDNCEELVEAVRGLVSTLLQAAPRMRILATSRIMLGARGERLLPVLPLPVDHAVQLLIDRGAAIRPQWGQALREHHTLPADAAAAARQVCQLLDGIPLAIEMVAAWLDVMTIQETLDHLHDRFRFLVAESDQPNHRSMRAALDSSYVLLSPAAQRMWKVAATFAGGFDLAAAQAVATAMSMDKHDVLTALTSLVRHSVLGTDTREGRTHYTMLETVRVYGKHLILDEPDTPDLRLAHADYFFELVTAAQADWLSAREIDWMHRLGNDVPNLRLALDYYRHTDRHDRALLMALLAAQTRFQIFAGQVDEARRWLRAGLEHYTTADELRVAALALTGWLSLIQGAPEEYTSLLVHCRETAVAAGCADTSGPLMLAEATRIWLAEPHRGKAREYIAMFEQAAERFEKTGQRGSHFMATMLGAFAACFLGDHATATRMTKNLVAEADAAEAPWCIAWSQWTCALLDLLHGGDLHAAMSWTQQALEMAWKMGDTWLPAWGLWLAGCIAAQMGMAERAAFLFGGTLQRQRRAHVMVDGLRPWWQVQQQAQRIARSALGEDEFAAQLALGESARSEDIMKVALQPVPRPHTDQDPAEAAAPAPVQGLSPREHEVAELVAQEWRNREIAGQLGISVRTVEVYVASLIRKLEAGSRVGVAVRFAALRQKSLPPD
jgi:predicted ATPase/DNA-binding CsgD family transcriptional regulator